MTSTAVDVLVQDIRESCERITVMVQAMRAELAKCAEEREQFLQEYTLTKPGE